MVETVGIPLNNFLCGKLRTELGHQVTVKTNSKVFMQLGVRVPRVVLISPKAMVN